MKDLFKDFSRLEEHSSLNAKGTGLGLSICKNIIEQMGGSIDVESKQGQGTKFKINLNLRATDRIVFFDLADSDQQKLEKFKRMKAFNFTDKFNQYFTEKGKRDIDQTSDELLTEYQFVLEQTKPEIKLM